MLSEQRAEALGGGGRVVAAVVVEGHVHLAGLLGQREHAPADLLELVVGVAPGEALGHGLAGQVAVGVAPVGAR